MSSGHPAFNDSGGVSGVVVSGSVAWSPLVDNWTLPDPSAFDVGNKTYVVKRDPLYVLIPITLIYILIFFTGIIGNVSTCIVIAKNRYMHTATNYYLFSLAISDLLLLISGLPPEMYHIWSKPYVFGEAFCIIRGLAAETSANATVLTITAFTVERYVAICHPLRSHTMSTLKRAVKYTVVIWLLALALAVPQAAQFGIVYETDVNGNIVTESAQCTVKRFYIEHAFEISTFVFFVTPMTLITVMYVLIGVKLRKSRLMARGSQGASIHEGGGGGEGDSCRRGRPRSSQTHVIRMLVAVVVAFFICWAPFHAQRLLAIYGINNVKEASPLFIAIYEILTYISGVFYYVSTTINPILYHILSQKFRQAFKDTIGRYCGWKGPREGRSYSVLSRCTRMQLHQQQQQQEFSDSSYRDGSIHMDRFSRRGTMERHGTLERKNRENEETEAIAQLPRASKHDVQNGCPSSRTPNSTNGSTKHVDGTVNGSGTGTELQPPPGILGTLHEEDSTGRTTQKCQPNKKKSSKKSSNKDKNANKCKKRSRHFYVLCKLRASRPSKSDPGSVVIDDLSPKTERNHKVACRLQSVDSTRSTNTISNSSLQDMDATEYTGEELATYMGELNERHSR